MGTVPIIVIFRVLPISHPQGHGKLGPPISQVIHLPGIIQSKKETPLYIYMKGPKQKGIISLEIVAYWFCMTRLFILYSYLAMRLRDCVQH